MLTMGSAARVVTTFGRRVVLLVLVTTIPRLPVWVPRVNLVTSLGAWRVETIRPRQVMLNRLRTL